MTQIIGRSPTVAGGSRSFSVVLFDLDDTLFAHQRAVGLGVAAHRHAHGGLLAAADDTAELARWHALEERHYHRYLVGELDFLGQRRARVRDFVAPYDLDLASDRAADQWYASYYVEYEQSWSLHDDAIPCLDGLRADAPSIRFGVITNSELGFQSAKIDRVGLGSYIEHTIASGELGFAKPDARIFEHACAVFDVAVSDAVYVGDRLRTDAIGSSAAGLTGVWLDRGSTASADDFALARACGVRVISTLADLPGLLTGR